MPLADWSIHSMTCRTELFGETLTRSSSFIFFSRRLTQIHADLRLFALIRGSNFGWDPDHRLEIRHVPHNNCTRADDRALTDPDLLSHHCADTDMRTWPNVNATRQSRSGRDMRVIADQAIMLDNRSGIDDHIVADHSIRVDDRAGHDRWANADLGG